MWVRCLPMTHQQLIEIGAASHFMGQSERCAAFALPLSQLWSLLLLGPNPYFVVCIHVFCFVGHFHVPDVFFPWTYRITLDGKVVQNL